MKIAFIHPDLGIGGAERLIVDAAVGLQKEGHEVVAYTSHCDRTHCFEEIKSNELKVKVYGDFLPTHFMNKFKIVFAALRQFVLILSMVYTKEILEYDYFIVDQLSFGLPLLHLFIKIQARILFYCHFPDQQLAKHDGLLRSLYRLPFDLFEQFSMTAADRVVVNSNFTKTVYDTTFTFIKDHKIPSVIYPCVDMTKEIIKPETEELYKVLIGDSKFFISINRFEAKKNIGLAIQAYADFLLKNPSYKSHTKLVITGGYDHNLEENKVYLQELETLISESHLKSLKLFTGDYSNTTAKETLPEFNVLILPSISSELKEYLLSKTDLLLYTPSYEHFGIVPLEGMKFGAPVLAINNGGPLETVIQLDKNPKFGTGWLEPSDPNRWSKRLLEALNLDKSAIASNGLKQLETSFSRKVMTRSFESELKESAKQLHQEYLWERLLVLWRVPAFLILRYVFKLNLTLSLTFLIVSFAPLIKSTEGIVY